MEAEERVRSSIPEFERAVKDRHQMKCYSCRMFPFRCNPFARILCRSGWKETWKQRLGSKLKGSLMIFCHFPFSSLVGRHL